MAPKKTTSARKSAPRKSAATSVAKSTAAKSTATQAPGAVPSMDDVKSQAAAISAARKPSTRAKPAPSGAVAKPVAAAPAKAAAPIEPSRPALRKKELLTAVVTRSGVKRRDAKAALEAALDIMGETIADGRDMNLPGFGKTKVARTKKQTRGNVYVTRIRQPEQNPDEDPGTPSDPLAEAAE